MSSTKDSTTKEDFTDSAITRCEIILKLGNFWKWQEAMEHNLTSFRDAGREILRGEKIDWDALRPIRTVNVVEEIQEDDGTIVEVTVQWNKSHTRKLEAAIAAYEKKKTTWQDDKGRLWPFIIHSISDIIKVKLKLRDTYPDIKIDTDTYELYSLIVKVTKDIARDNIQALKNKWSALKHGPGESIGEFILKFEQAIKEIEHGGEVTSDSAKVYQLSQAVNKQQWQVPLSDVYTKDQNAVDYPAYDVIRQRLITWEEQVGSAADSEGHPDVKQSKKQLSDSELNKVKSYLSSLLENNNSKYDRGGRGNGRGVRASGRGGRDQGRGGRGHGRDRGRAEDRRKSESLSTAPKRRACCFNCGDPTHFADSCPEAATVCSKCGKSWHMAIYCKYGKKKRTETNDAEADKPSQKNDDDNDDEDGEQKKIKKKVKLSSYTTKVQGDFLTNSKSFVSHAINNKECKPLLAYKLKDVESHSGSDLPDSETELEEEIIVDSGATYHVEQSVDEVDEYARDNRHNEVSMTGIDGLGMRVTHLGTLPQVGKFLVVPNSDAVLLSVAELCKAGNTCTFDNTGVTIAHPGRESVYGKLNDSNHYVVNRSALKKLRGEVDDAKAYPTNVVAEEMLYTEEQRERARQVILLHVYSGHPSDESLINALSNGVLTGTTLTAQDVRNARAIFGSCTNCMAGKVVSHTATPSDNNPAGMVGEVLHADIYPLSEPAYGDYMNMLIAVDEFSGYIVIVPLKSKHLQNINDSFNSIIATFKSFHHTVQKIQCDSESALKAAKQHLNNLEIEMNYTPPDMHAQRVERYVRTVKDRERCILSSTPVTIPSALHGELVKTAVMHLNDFPSTRFPAQSPRMIVEGTKLDLNKRLIVPFGTVAMLHTPRRKRKPGEARSHLGVILGPSPNTYGAIEAWNLATEKVVTRFHFDVLAEIPEGFPWEIQRLPTPLGGTFKQLTTVVPVKRKRKRNSKSKLTLSFDPKLLTPTFVRNNATEPATNSTDSLIVDDTQESAEAMNEEILEATIDEPLPAEPTREGELLETFDMDELDHIPLGESNEYTSQDESNSQIHQSKSKRVKLSGNNSNNNKAKELKIRSEQNRDKILKLPLRRTERRILSSWKDGNRKLSVLFALAYRISVKQAIVGEHAQESIEAINDEIQNMLTYKVGHYVHYHDIPYALRRNILQSFMFVKHKETPDGRYDRTKARMVGNGANQKDHMYDLISSSTVALSSVFLLFNIASYYKCILASYDIKGAFLNAQFGEGDETTYIKINKELTELWIKQDPTAAEFVSEKGELILELDKFIYGLKQSPYKFQQHLINVLVSLGYKQQVQDECLFIKHSGDDFSLLSTHVDDILQVCTSQAMYNELKTGLIQVYGEITTKDKADAYLGMSIERTECLEYVKLTQKGLINKILEKYPPGNKSGNTPAADDIFDTTRSTESAPVDKSEFLGLVMTLMYLARLTRPDILLPVTFLASRSHCATQHDVKHALRIVSYLQHTIDVGIIIHCVDLQIRCVCDASYGVHTDGKSHTGFFLAMGAQFSYLHGRSGKQKLNATSSTDAEILAMVECLKMAIWLRNVLRDLQITRLRPLQLLQDNKSAIIMITEPSKFKRSKHILTKVLYAKGLVIDGSVLVNYIETEEMTADILTKPKQGATFVYHVGNMMGMKWSWRFS